MHLLPADRAGCRVIDEERVCRAIASLGDPESVRTQAQHHAVLADPTRLTLLTCIAAAGPISVSDLAAATGLLDTTVSQALRYLRAAQIVSAQRDGRIIRYVLANHPVRTLLASP
jgi:DNA-binding transcriptional ArsR family regulator